MRYTTLKQIFDDYIEIFSDLCDFSVDCLSSGNHHDFYTLEKFNYIMREFWCLIKVIASSENLQADIDSERGVFLVKKHFDWVYESLSELISSSIEQAKNEKFEDNKSSKYIFRILDFFIDAQVFLAECIYGE